MTPERGHSPDASERSEPIRLAVGIVMLVIGLLHELLSRPLQPIIYVPGLAFIPFGAGIGLGVLARRIPNFILPLSILAAILVTYVSTGADASLLPVALLLGMYNVTRAGIAMAAASQA